MRRDLLILFSAGSVLLGVFVIYPVFYTLILSFFRYELGSPPQFVGLAQYERLVNYDTPPFPRVMWNSVVVMLVAPLSIGLGLGFALLLRDVWGAPVLRTLVMSGLIIPPTVVTVTWMLALHPESGIVNAVLRALGLGPTDFLYDPETQIWAVVLIATWAWVGFTMITFLANLEAIPRELYEAAAVDGASRWQVFARITLPLLRPALVVNTVMSILYALKLFDVYYVIGVEAAPLSSMNLSYFIYFVLGYEFDYGLASAAAVILTVMVLAASFYIIKRLVEG